VQVSVALAARNNERHVEALLDSLARQTQLPLELVVSDDASEDGTPAILRQFAARAPFPVTVERFEERRGHVEAFVAAARRCSGEAIAFCDADDVWSEAKIATCAQALARGPATLALHAARVVDEGLRSVGRDWPSIARGPLVPPLGLAGFEVHAPGMAMVFRSSLLQVADFETRPPSRYGADGAMLHDEWIFFLAGAMGPIALVAEPLVLYRQHGSSASQGALDETRPRSLRPALANYRRAARQAGACADYLERAAAVSAADGVRLAEAAREYRRMARAWELRESLYGARRLRRATLLRQLVAQRAYRPRRAGGFGRAALAKDVVAGVMLGVPAEAEVP